MKKLLVMSIFAIALFGCSSNEDTVKEKDNAGEVVKDDQKKEDSNKKDALTFGSTFTFDDLDITIGDSYDFGVVNNEFSDHHEKDVVKIPVIIKNNSDDTHGLNMFYLSTYGSEGSEQESLYFYFDDGDKLFKELRPDASIEGNIYALYDGDGEYYLEFSNFATKVGVKLEIKK